MISYRVQNNVRNNGEIPIRVESQYKWGLAIAPNKHEEHYF